MLAVKAGEVGLAGLCLAVVTLAVGIYYGRRSVKEKRPVFFATSVNLVQDVTNRVDGVEVTYRGQPVTTLTVTKVGFWNAGRETINKEDVSDNDPLRIELAEGVVRDTTILATTSPTVSPEVSGSAESPVVALTFDFLDRKQGMLIQLMHTGPETVEVALKGSIRGAGEPRRRDEEPWWLVLGAIFATGGIVLGVGALAAAIVAALNGPDWLRIVVACAAGIGGFVLSLLLFERWESFITRVPPALSGIKLPRLEKRLPGAHA
jgi:hypothetical protein